MSPDLLAGGIAGLVAVIPYAILAMRGRPAPSIEEPEPNLPGWTTHAGAALGALLGAQALTHLVFFLSRATMLTEEPSVWWWGGGLALPVLLTGWLSYQGVLSDQPQGGFLPLASGVFLGLVGFLGLPIGLVVFLAGMIFGGPPIART